MPLKELENRGLKFRLEQKHVLLRREREKRTRKGREEF